MEIKRENERRIIEAFQQQSLTVEGLPSQLWIESTQRCNLECRICPRSYRDYEGKDLPLEIFNQVRDELFPTLTCVHLHGFGEPLLARNFWIFFEQAVDHKIRVSLVTNGTLLNKPCIERFVQHPTNLIVSFDAATEATFTHIRPTLKVNHLIEQIEYFNEFKTSKYPHSSSTLHLIFVATRWNIEELPRLVEIAAQWNVYSLQVVDFQLAELPEELKPYHLSYCPELANRLFLSAREKAKELGVTLQLPHFYPGGEVTFAQSCPEVSSNSSAAEFGWQPMTEEFYDNVYKRMENKYYSSLCAIPWTMAYIDAQGNVYPCCIFYKTMGNLKETSFKEIWNNQKYQRLRQRIHSFFPPLVCKECNIPCGISGGNPAKLLQGEKTYQRILTKLQKSKRYLKAKVWQPLKQTLGA